METLLFIELIVGAIILIMFFLAAYNLNKITKWYKEKYGVNNATKRKKRRGPWSGIHWYGIGFIALLVLWAYFTKSFADMGCSVRWSKLWSSILVGLMLVKPLMLFVNGCKTFDQTRIYWIMFGSKLHTVIYLNDDGRYNNPHFEDYDPNFRVWEFVPAQPGESMERYQAPEGLLPWLVWKCLKRRFIGLDGFTTVDTKPITREVKVATGHVLANPNSDATRHAKHPERLETLIGSGDASQKILPNDTIILRVDNTDSAPRVARSTFLVTDCDSLIKAKIHKVREDDKKKGHGVEIQDVGAKLAALVSLELHVENAALYRLSTGSSDLYYEINPLVETVTKELLSKLTYEEGTRTSGLRVVKNDAQGNDEQPEAGEKILINSLADLNESFKRIGISCKSFLLTRVEPMPQYRYLVDSAADIQKEQNLLVKELITDEKQRIANQREIDKQEGLDKAKVAGSIALADKISKITDPGQLDVLKRSVTPTGIETLVEGANPGITITPAKAA